MSSELDDAVEQLLDRVTSGSPRVPGVVAIATDREGNIFEGAAGVRVLGDDVAMTTDTVCAIYSTTKAIAGTACLQLVEDGSLDLDAPAKNYAPDIGALQVLDGFDDRGVPRLRAPKREITTRMLLLHTAGFGYDFYNADYNRLAREHGQPSVVTASKAALRTPLLFDPGERWEYGSGVDWAGQVVEGITNERLGDVLKARIFEPLNMQSTAFSLTDEMRTRLARIHQRRSDGSLKALRNFELPADPEVQMGGHALYSTALDYAKFIRMWLNGGAAPDGTSVLRRDTVELAERNGLGDLKVRALPAVNPRLTNEVEFFPGMPKSWALTFMINEQDAPTGRSAGSLAWGGLANLYYWIDRTTGLGGFWATQLFPFADPTSLGGYLEFETAVYRSPRA